MKRDSIIFSMADFFKDVADVKNFIKIPLYVVTNKEKRKHQTTTGKAGSMAKDIMDRHGQKFDAYYRVIMPDTWTPVFDLTNKNRVDKWLSDGKKQLKLVIGNIMSKRKGNFVDRKLYSRKPEL